MTPYIVIAVFAAALASLGDFVHRRAAQRKGGEAPEPRLTLSYFDLMALVALVVFSGSRHGVGTDYRTYERVFESLDVHDWGKSFADSPQEFGFTALMLVIKLFSDSPQALFWVCSTLTIVPIYSVLKRHSGLPALSVTLYVLLGYVGPFNTVRQGLAIALVFLAWSFLGKRSGKFYVLAILASTIHLSALFASLAIIFIWRRKLSTGTISVVVVSVIVASVLLERMPVTFQTSGDISSRYGGYLHSSETGIGAYLQIVAYAQLLAFALLVGRIKHPVNDRDKHLAALVIIGIAFMIVGTQAVIVFRMSSYFTIFAVLLISNRIAVIKDRPLAAGIITSGAFAYYVAFLASYGDLVPYESTFKLY